MIPRLLATACATLVLAAVPASALGADRPVLNIGHRGASGLAPEHTIAAYDLALRLGADYIEQDLQMTSDGVLVVLHDASLDRTARGAGENCSGPVASKTLAQVKTCDVGSWFNEAHPELARPAYAGQRVPTLEQVLQRYRSRANFYIETKNPETAPDMEEKLLALISRYGLRAEAARRWKVLIQSFSPESLLKVRALDASLPLIQLLPAAGIAGPTMSAVAQYAVGIGPSSAGVDAALVADAHAHCLGVHPYTVNDPAEMDTLLTAGVDGMFTNFPDRLDALLGADSLPLKHAGERAARHAAACRAG